ncbi:MAG: hypothetical protein LBK83_00500 [Treponema sp.]|jgi:hypothetical protein|nr:hypothetical protein [Treponema sp.]
MKIWQNNIGLIKTFQFFLLLFCISDISAEGDRESLDHDYLHLKIVNLTKSDITVYINNSIPILIEGNEFYITDKIIILNFPVPFLFIKYNDDTIKLLQFRDVTHWLHTIHQFHIVVFDNDIKMLQDNVNVDYDYHDSTVNLNHAYWYIIDNDKNIKINIINNSFSRKKINVHDKDIKSFELNVSEKCSFVINDLFFSFFYLTLNIRDYDKPFNEDDNFQLLNTYYQMDSTNEINIILDKSRSGMYFSYRPF